jgi:DNA-binding CsgD family transcriptional regulator
MALSTAKLSSLLQLLYEAAGCPQLFPGFLDALGVELRADKAYFILFDPLQRCDFSLQYGFDDRAARDYSHEYSKYDVLAQGFVDKVQKHGEWIGTSRSVISDSEYQNSEIYNGFAKPNRQRYFCAAGLDLTGTGLRGGLGLSRPPTAPEFDAEAVALLAMLAPHLRQALLLHQSITDLKTSQAVLDHAFERSERPIIYLDSHGKILRMTASARKILNMDNGLMEDHGTLRTTNKAEQKRLDVLISDATTAGNGLALERPVRADGSRAPEIASHALWTPAYGGTMQLSRKPPRRALNLTVAPFIASVDFFAHRPSAVLFLSEPDFKLRSRSAVLRSLYNLSPSECRVAEQLADGQEISAIAEELGRTVEGTRFQLKSIFRKTGTRRQAELIRLILSLPSVGH